MSSDYTALRSELTELQNEFYAEKQKLIDTFDDRLNERLSAHPDYAKLIKQYAPSTKYVDSRLSFEIDTIKLDIGVTDPNSGDLAETLSRDSNSVRSRLVVEIARFIDDTLKGSIEKDQRIVKANLNPISKTLLPKIKSFALLHAEFQRVHSHIEKHVIHARNLLEARPNGNAFIDEARYEEFVCALSKVRTRTGVEEILDEHIVTPMFTKTATRPVDAAEPQSERPPAFITGKTRVNF